MASHTKLYASNFDNNDKKEMMKRIQAEQNLIAKRTNKPSSPKSTTPSLNEMASKVKEVLPQVPLSVIKCDIAITKNIDDTIERILNETVPYTAEEPPKESQRAESSNFNRTTAQMNSESGKLFYCGASSFGVSASDRSKSFQERKEHLFRVARMRYIQKHHMANK